MEQQLLEAIQEIMEHITVLNDEYGKIAVSVGILEERVDWLCKFFWLVAGTVITTFLLNIYQTWKIVKNGKK